MNHNAIPVSSAALVSRPITTDDAKAYARFAYGLPHCEENRLRAADYLGKKTPAHQLGLFGWNGELLLAEMRIGGMEPVESCGQMATSQPRCIHWDFLPPHPKSLSGVDYTYQDFRKNLVIFFSKALKTCEKSGTINVQLRVPQNLIEAAVKNISTSLGDPVQVYRGELCIGPGLPSFEFKTSVPLRAEEQHLSSQVSHAALTVLMERFGFRSKGFQLGNDKPPHFLLSDG
jgi:hypothetical protein